MNITHDFNSMNMSGVFIGISGLIGAGKTTLAEALAKELNLPVFYEPVTDNTYLEDFYTDMKKYSFGMQIFLLNKRFKQQQQIVWSGSGGVQDRTIYEDSVFAKMLYDGGLMDKRDYETYCELFQNMSNFMKKPNIIVHLDLSPEESYRRIQMRSRDCESGISLEYLKGLHAAYEVFIKDIARIIPVIKVDYSRFRTPEEMASAIKSEYQKIANIREVSFDKKKKDDFTVNDEKQISAKNVTSSQAKSPSSVLTEE
jgi:deoxyadenosine kinase|tara:strand:+ start:63 stop:830 length:768 start_codon:yes stop_codon:yes gene_type:complete